MTLQSAWQSVEMPRYPKLRESEKFDVVVVGSGIMGLTAAYLLKKAGKRVAVLERDSIGHGETSRTTAHLTYVTDLRLSEMAKHFGRDEARLVWQGGAAAINTIEEISRQEGIDCEFRRIPGFLHAPLESSDEERDKQNLHTDYELARELGFEASFLNTVPRVHRPGVRFANQAKFHPLKYLAGLAQVIDGDGCRIFEESEAEQFEQEPTRVTVGEYKLECDYLIIATHVPLMGKTGLLGATLFQSKIAPYSSYAIGAKIPKGLAPEASFWDTADPYNYLRIDRHEEGDYAIFGGADHKTGQVSNTQENYQKIEALLRRLFPSVEVDRRWSGQVIETNDGLPYMGETAKGQFVATGFAGNGMTFGTLAGMMSCDAAQGRANPWQELFDVHRKKLRGGVWDYVKENFDYPYYLLKDRLRRAEGTATDEVQCGEGKILKLEGQRVACYRDEDGRLSTVSAICTHMGCVVHWNRTENTWDCPCHGSRFQPDGHVLGGPAETPLEPVDLGTVPKQESR